MLAIVFLSAIVIKATVNNTGTVTANTSRIEMIVVKYNIFKNKNYNIKITINTAF
jgi:hypothetical protein